MSKTMRKTPPLDTWDLRRKSQLHHARLSDNAQQGDYHHNTIQDLKDEVARLRAELGAVLKAYPPCCGECNSSCAGEDDEHL